MHPYLHCNYAIAMTFAMSIHARMKKYHTVKHPDLLVLSGFVAENIHGSGRDSCRIMRESLLGHGTTSCRELIMTINLCHIL
jgi:hypothetical protein